jgi:hypothetical protein
MDNGGTFCAVCGDDQAKQNGLSTRREGLFSKSYQRLPSHDPAPTCDNPQH